VLAVGALLAGIVFKEYFVGHDEALFWGTSLLPFAGQQHRRRVPPCAAVGRVVAVRCHGAGLAVSWLFYIRKPDLPGKLAEQHQPVYQFLLNKWYIDELYDLIFVRPAKWLGRFFWKKGDGWLIDGFGPDGISARVLDTTNRIVKLQSGFVYHYAFAMMIGSCADHLVHVRRSPLMTGWYILSTLTFLPLVGALFIWVIRGDDDVARRNIRQPRCGDGDQLPLSLLAWSVSTRAQPGFQLEDKVSWLGG
jgi:hypothetical protein